jgi:hypothetical protein
MGRARGFEPLTLAPHACVLASVLIKRFFLNNYLAVSPSQGETSLLGLQNLSGDMGRASPISIRIKRSAFAAKLAFNKSVSW